jgi:hypothetical protein
MRSSKPAPKPFEAALAAVEALVATVAKEMSAPGIPLPDRNEALKLLTPYYLLWKKQQFKDGQDEDDGATFGDFANAINGGQEDSGGIHARRRAGN